MIFVQWFFPLLDATLEPFLKSLQHFIRRNFIFLTMDHWSPSFVCVLLAYTLGVRFVSCKVDVIWEISFSEPNQSTLIKLSYKQANPGIALKYLLLVMIEFTLLIKYAKLFASEHYTFPLLYVHNLSIDMNCLFNSTIILHYILNLDTHPHTHTW